MRHLILVLAALGLSACATPSYLPSAAEQQAQQVLSEPEPDWIKMFYAGTLDYGAAAEQWCRERPSPEYTHGQCTQQAAVAFYNNTLRDITHWQQRRQVAEQTLANLAAERRAAEADRANRWANAAAIWNAQQALNTPAPTQNTTCSQTGPFFNCRTW